MVLAHVVLSLLFTPTMAAAQPTDQNTFRATISSFTTSSISQNQATIQAVGAAVFPSSVTATAFFGSGAGLTGISGGSSSGPFINSGNTVVQSTPSYQVVISSSLVNKSSAAVSNSMSVGTTTFAGGNLLLYGALTPSAQVGNDPSIYHLKIDDGTHTGHQVWYSFNSGGYGGSYYKMELYNNSGTLISGESQGDPGDQTISYFASCVTGGGQCASQIIGGNGAGLYANSFLRLGSFQDVTIGDGIGGQLDVTNDQIQINNGSNGNPSNNPFIVYDNQGQTTFEITSNDPGNQGDYVTTLNNILDNGSGTMSVSNNLDVGNNLAVSGSFSSDGGHISSDGAGTLSAITLVGNGSNISALNGTSITLGTVGSAHLPTDLAYTDKSNTFTSSQTFTNGSFSIASSTFSTNAGNVYLSTTTGLGVQMYRCSGGTAANLLVYGASGAEQTVCTTGGGTLVSESVWLK